MATMNNAIPLSEGQLCERLRAALLADPAVYDCAVLLKKHGGLHRFVVYMVPNGPVATDRLSFRARAVLGTEIDSLPDYVFVSSLPITSQGRVDEDRLCSLVAPDDEQFRLWEKELKETELIQDVAIVSRNVNGRWTPPPLPNDALLLLLQMLHCIVWFGAERNLTLTYPFGETCSYLPTARGSQVVFAAT